MLKEYVTNLKSHEECKKNEYNLNINFRLNELLFHVAWINLT